MNLYTVALFVHLVGAMAIFVGVGVWLFAALALRRAQHVAQVRILTGITVGSGNVAVGGVLLLAVAGFYMALSVWGWQTAWIDVATVGFALLAPLGLLIIDPRLRALAKAADAAPDGPMPPSLVAGTRDPLLSSGLSLYVAVLLGIVFLMTTKPAWVEALLAMVVAVALGLVSSLPFWLAPRAARERKAQ
jgi:Predicted integral membrane protein (DUF2269)